MLNKLIAWLNARIGFRPALDEGVPAAHRASREFAKIWFEGLKRVGMLAVLAAAAKSSFVAEVLYWIGLLAFMMPVVTWAGQWEMDLRTRNPTMYRPKHDGEVVSPAPPDSPPVWAYSTPLIFASSLLATIIVNFGIQTVVLHLTTVLSEH